MLPGYHQLDLYTADGWPDFEAIKNVGALMVVLVGARRIGKTYAIVRDAIQTGKRMLYLRLSDVQLKRCANPVHDPFIPPASSLGFDTSFEEITDGLYQVREVLERDEKGKPKEYGRTFADAVSVFSTRGIASGMYDCIFLDEFIPEKGAVIRKDSGYNLKSAIQTVTDEEHADIQVWLAANSNNLDNDILHEFDLIPIFETLASTDNNCWLSDDGGTLAIHFKKSPISDKLAKTRLGRILNTGAYGAMAFSNEWSNNNFANVRKLTAAELRAYCDVLVIGDMLIMGHKSEPRYYVRKIRKAPAKVTAWEINPDLPKKIASMLPVLQIKAFDGSILYDSFDTKRKYLEIVNGGKRK